MKTLAHPLEKELYSNRNNPAYAGAQQSMQQLRKLADLSKIHIPPLQPMSGEVWIDGFKQLFGFPHFDPSWEDVMIKAALRLLIAEYDVIMLTKKVTGRNIKFHSTGESNLEEITRWVLHLQPRGIGHKQILCVHHPRNLQEKWTVRFDWRLPAKSDNAKYPFCPPDTPDQKKGKLTGKGWDC
ncbi:MAG: hypothetical protein H7A23_17900 [Leptospiraceae bacterium]|nr:hypothetical protein [Leptospiraceae bacterium]MCP5496425.1 hypothetical protein [Leptospiraceae bacterium]